MHTVTLEILRTGTPHNQTLSPGITYLALCGTHPPSEFRIEMEQFKFNRLLSQIRYVNSTPASRNLAVEALQELTTDIFNNITPLKIEANCGNTWLHLRLIITAKELAMLPFEFALTPDGFQGAREKPLLLNQQRPTTLTREVRQVNSKKYTWPYKPRILFVWAEPGDLVPHKEHYEKLENAVSVFALPYEDTPEPIPDVRPLITEKGNASLRDIKKELENGIDQKNPYTHVHILAHGIESVDENGQHFALALHNESDPKQTERVDGLQLASAIVVVREEKLFAPTVVTLTACDSGNINSPILPGGSLAHSLHQSGIPCVFASQFPLSIEGSIKLVDCLYPQLVRGEDPRVALYYTREAIESPAFHDWASLVAYAVFPDDIEEQLEDIKLKNILESMKTTNGWTDHILEMQDKIDPKVLNEKFSEVKGRLDEATHNLEAHLEKTKNTNTKKGAENYGLLGSVYKRLSEHFFHMSKINGINKPSAELIGESINALETSKNWYKKGFDLNPSNNWPTTQYLSICAVSRGSLNKQLEIWLLAKFSAEMDLKSQDLETRIWALGTLAELYLLKPFTLSKDKVVDSIPGCIEIGKKFMADLADSDFKFAKESTARQFGRYITWWPALYAETYREELKEMAIEILEGLNKDDE